MNQGLGEFNPKKQRSKISWDYPYKASKSANQQTFKSSKSTRLPEQLINTTNRSVINKSYQQRPLK